MCIEIFVLLFRNQINTNREDTNLIQKVPVIQYQELVTSEGANKSNFKEEWESRWPNLGVLATRTTERIYTP